MTQVVFDNDSHPEPNPATEPPPLAVAGYATHNAPGRLMSAAGVLAAVMAVATPAACGSCGPDAPVPVLGSVSLGWTMTDVNGRLLSCEQASATTVSLTMRNRASGSSVAASFACQASPSAQRLAPGVYDATIALRSSEGAIASVADQTSVLVVAGQVTPLAPARFQVTAGLVLSFAASPMTANCTLPAEGGAGITTATLALLHTGAGCAPVTFVRTRGNTVVERYLVNCSAPSVTSCIETNETFTVVPIEPGTYSLRVRARIGPLNCWVRDEDINVSLGAPVTRTINLTPTRIPGCPAVPLGPTAFPSRGSHD